MSLEIRSARAGEEGLVLALIGELAAYEKLAHEVDAREADIREALFGADPRAFCAIAEWEGEPAGMALWFYNFSTFRGRHGIYLEDLYVRPQHRRRGIGQALLRHLAGICLDEGLARLEWWVLDWNTPAIDFYRTQGAQTMDDWTVCRVTGDALEKLAGRKP